MGVFSMALKHKSDIDPFEVENCTSVRQNSGDVESHIPMVLTSGE